MRRALWDSGIFQLVEHYLHLFPQPVASLNSEYELPTLFLAENQNKPHHKVWGWGLRFGVGV